MFVPLRHLPLYLAEVPGLPEALKTKHWGQIIKRASRQPNPPFRTVKRGPHKNSERCVYFPEFVAWLKGEHLEKKSTKVTFIIPGDSDIEEVNKGRRRKGAR